METGIHQMDIHRLKSKNIKNYYIRGELSFIPYEGTTNKKKPHDTTTPKPAPGILPQIITTPPRRPRSVAPARARAHPRLATCAHLARCGTSFAHSLRSSRLFITLHYANGRQRTPLQAPGDTSQASHVVPPDSLPRVR